MCKQNAVYRGHDNDVVVEVVFEGDFAADGLFAFDDIKIEIGGEEYTLRLNPDNVIIESGTELAIRIGNTTNLQKGEYKINIIGYSYDYPNGFVLTHCPIDAVKVI